MKSNIEQQKQAKKMMANSLRKFKPAHAGDTVMVLIPLVDYGRARFPNVKAILFQALDNGTYKLDRRHGLFTQCLENSFQLMM